MIHRYSRPGLLFCALSALSFGACKKDTASKEQAPVQTPAEAPVAQQELPAPNTEPVANADYFYVEIAHSENKPGDPVRVNFPGMSVQSASFDADNLEGGSAHIEIDLSVIDSGIPKRDGHLASPDYFDTAKHPKAVIKIKDVKKQESNTYSATADVSVHGIDKTWPVEFTVVEATEDKIVVEAQHSFSRLDFEIGKAEEDAAATDVLARLRITLPNS